LLGCGPVPIYVELKHYKGQDDLAPLLAQAAEEAKRAAERIRRQMGQSTKGMVDG